MAQLQVQEYRPTYRKRDEKKDEITSYNAFVHRLYEAVTKLRILSLHYHCTDYALLHLKLKAIQDKIVDELFTDLWQLPECTALLKYAEKIVKSYTTLFPQLEREEELKEVRFL